MYCEIFEADNELRITCLLNEKWICRNKSAPVEFTAGHINFWNIRKTWGFCLSFTTVLPLKKVIRNLKLLLDNFIS